jgi:hypothetical protein
MTPPTHTEYPRPHVPPWRAIYDKLAPGLALLILIIALAAGVGTYFNDRAIAKANADRLSDQGDLLACFDLFATNLAGGLPPVREASAARDDARAAWENASDAVSKAIEAALARAVAGEPTDGSQVPVILGAFHDLDVASAALDRANAHLDKVRADNPYPKPPSEFCSAAG